jgi:meso-butanediol dehydrogenase/(S,S)-butanediol dehydrogenase/diacetyl reductase
MMKAAVPKMIAAGGGVIINVASLAGVVAFPGGPAYCSAKAGLIHLTKQVAFDYGKDKIRCNVICPGPVRTTMLEGNFMGLAKHLNVGMDGLFDLVSENVPLRRVAAPADIAGVFVFLAGDDSNFMTGSTVLVDGGVHFVDAFASGLGKFGASWT